MNDWGGADNFTALMNILYIVWVQSSHFLLEAYQIEYKSEELLGFYETSHDFILSKDARKIAGIKFYNNLSEFRPTYMGSIGVYHRVGLINSSKIETPENIKIPTILPAFFLMGIDDKTAAANTETAIGVAVEVLTTLTGIGNLTKFRHLYRIWKATSTYSKTLVAIKIGISAIEITSGALGTMLTLAGSNCNGKFCDGLRNVLFWMDLASLSVDLTTSRMLKNSAKQTLKNLDSLPKMNQIEYDELVESLERIAGVKVVKKRQKYSRNPTKLDADLLSHIRNKYKPRPTRNVAFAIGEVGDIKIDLECVSGGKKSTSWKQKGNFEPPKAEDYFFKNGPENFKVNHTEQNILEYLYHKFKHNKDVVGRIELVSDLLYCDNCYWIADKFEKTFPNIEIIRVYIKKNY